MTTLLSPEVAIFLAGGSYVLGYLIINQVWLRLMILLGTAFYILYYFIVAETPLWEAIYLSILIGLANLLGLLGLYLRQSKFLIPQKFRGLYAQFEGMPPADFRDLVGRAEWRVLTGEEEPTREGQPVTRLTFVISGNVLVEKLNERFAMPSGIFIGEVAFLTGQTASATTWVAPGSEILQWDVAMLRERSARRPRFKMALEAMISKDLAAKVTHAVAPHSMTWSAEPQESSS